MFAVNIIQGGLIKTAPLCKVDFARVLNSAELFHFDSDIEVRYINTLYKNILCKIRFLLLHSFWIIKVRICIITIVLWLTMQNNKAIKGEKLLMICLEDFTQYPSVSNII